MRWPRTLLLLSVFWLSFLSHAWSQTCPGPQPEVEPNDTFAQATPLTLASPSPFNDVFLPAPGFTTPGDVDFFRVTLLVDTRLWVLVDTGTTGGGTSRDSVLQVLRPDGSLLEEDDDDGTGMSPQFAINTTESSVVAGMRVGVSGTYYLRVAARDPASSMAYRLLVMTTPEVADTEVEPNDTPAQATQPSSFPTIQGTLSAGDIDCYRVTILDHGVPFLVADARPEAALPPTDLTMTLHMFSGQVPINSSPASSRPAEAVLVLWEGGLHACLTGTNPGPGTPAYRMGVFWSAQCPLPVELQSFEVR